MSPTKPAQNKPAPKSWRKVLDVHKACELFPPMLETDPAALKELGEDIKKNGFLFPIMLGRRNGKEFLIDGRNRLDALEMVGFNLIKNDKLDEALGTECGALKYLPSGLTDAAITALVISFNIHRRHLTPEKKDELIALLLKATPEKSNRQIAKTVGKSHPHVAKVRKALEESGDVETVSTSIDTKGRKQPAKRAKKYKYDKETDAAMEAVREIVELPCPDCGGATRCPCPNCSGTGVEHTTVAKANPNPEQPTATAIAAEAGQAMPSTIGPMMPAEPARIGFGKIVRGGRLDPRVQKARLRRFIPMMQILRDTCETMLISLPPVELGPQEIKSAREIIKEARAHLLKFDRLLESLAPSCEEPPAADLPSADETKH